MNPTQGWAVSAGAEAVTLTPPPGVTSDLRGWAEDVRARLPNGEVLAPTVQDNQLVWPQRLPTGSKITSSAGVLARIE